MAHRSVMIIYFLILLPLADGNALMLTPTCSANTAELEIVFSENDDYNIRVRIDYICIGKDSQKVGGRFSAIGSHSHRQCNTGLT